MRQLSGNKTVPLCHRQFFDTVMPSKLVVLQDLGILLEEEERLAANGSEEAMVFALELQDAVQLRRRKPRT